MENKAIVVGLGFAGSVLARRLADAGYTVHAFEKRFHIAGNMYEYERRGGVRVHMYGPHIFHTNSKTVLDYLSRFSAFYPYSHRVLGKIDNVYVPIPFNFTSIDMLFPKEKAEVLKAKLSMNFMGKDRVFISQLLDHDDQDIAQLGAFIYENVFVHYTAKQWGVPASSVDTTVINRVPVILGTDDRYFSDTYQMMPMQGFTKLFENLLDHPNIHIELESDALNYLQFNPDLKTIFLDGIPFSGPVCFTGRLDELFEYQFGTLPYRSIRMAFEDLDVDFFQTASVVNYPNEEEYTRITEFKYMTLQQVNGHTTILKEYPLPYKAGGAFDPYYPIICEENLTKYQEYQNLRTNFRNLYLCGRLAEYKYYNMDAVILRALEISSEIIAETNKAMLN